MMRTAETASNSISAKSGVPSPLMTGVSFTSWTVIATPCVSSSRGDPLSRTRTVTPYTLSVPVSAGLSKLGEAAK